MADPNSQTSRAERAGVALTPMLQRLGARWDDRLATLGHPTSQKFSDQACAWYDQRGVITAVGNQSLEELKQQLVKRHTAAVREWKVETIMGLIGLTIPAAFVLLFLPLGVVMVLAVGTLLFLGVRRRDRYCTLRAAHLGRVRQLDERFEWARVWAAMSEVQRAALRRQNRTTIVGLVGVGVPTAAVAVPVALVAVGAKIFRFWA